MYPRKILTATLVLLFVIVSGCSTEPDVKEITKMAEAGDAEQQTRLGVMYLYGHHVERDFVKASDLLEKALAQGYGHAGVYLGLLHETGPSDSPFKPNCEKAREYYEKGALRGDVASMKHLAELYNGTTHRITGVSQHGAYEKHEVAHDPRKAKEWYEKAADSGDVDSQYTVGTMYLNGVVHEKRTVVEPDLKKAREYFVKAADQGNKLAQFEAGSMYRSSLGSPTWRPPKEIKMEELKIALKYFELSCKQGYVEACHQCTGVKDDMSRLKRSTP